MLELHSLLRRMQLDKEKFKQVYTEGEDLVKVRESLNNRIIQLRNLMLEQPDNESLNFELEFCLSEAERIEEEIEKFQAKYGSKQSQINIHKQIIDYELRELYTYIGFLKKLETDEELVTAIKNSVESIEEEMSMLEFLEK